MFLSMALISVLARPIVFREKWQGGVGYGLPSALYLLLFFLMLFSEYNIVQTIKTSSSNGVPQVSVQGPVTAVEPKSATKSVFQEIPIREVEKLPIQEATFTSVNTDTSTETTATTTVSNNDALAGNSNTTTATTITSTNNGGNTQYIDANGNGTIIGDTDSKIYHLPGGAYYEREMQKTSNNVYFKTTAEAEAAGYRASKR